MASNCSVKFPSIIWSTARSSFESRKATVLARMKSGRFRSEYLTRHWSTNKQGLCLADTCSDTVGDLEHMLIQCPALDSVRTRMWSLMFDKAIAFPPLHSFFLVLEKSTTTTEMLARTILISQKFKGRGFCVIYHHASYWLSWTTTTQ